MPNTFTPTYNLPNGYVQNSTDTPVLATGLNAVANIVDSQIRGALRTQGVGVVKDYAGEFIVTPGSGLSVVVGTGAANTGTVASPVSVFNPSPQTLSGLEASRGAGNPLYLHVGADDGTNSGNVSFQTGIPLYQISDYASLPGLVQLAKITTTASTVTVTPNPNRFLKGGTGGSPLSVTDSTGDTEANVALLDFPHLTLVGGQLVSYEFFEDGDTIPAGTAVAVVEVPDAVETRQTKTTNYTMLATDRRLVMIATANRTATLRPTAEMYASGEEYGFAYRANGTPDVLLTLQADGPVIYNGTSDVSSYTVDDGEMITLVGYLRADNTPGLFIKSST